MTTLIQQLAQLLDGTPVADIKRNSRAVAAAILSRMEVVSREEFDAHCDMLSQTTARLADLEKKLAMLETGKPAKPAPDNKTAPAKRIRRRQ